MLKEELYRLCIDFVSNREAEIKKVIAEAQDAANNETKSSAGDKYETGREVMQQEINLNLARLSELGKLMATLEHITPTQTGTAALPTVFDLNQLVRDTLKLLERQTQAIQVRSELSTVELWVRGDLGRLQQVLVNITVNALDAMREGGSLTVRTGYSEKPGFCRVAISDTGNGIREDQLPHIFEPFYTTKEVGRGVGLGLAISYGIVRQHGGDIEVQSQVGAGTTFRVMLPAVEEA